LNCEQCITHLDIRFVLQAFDNDTGIDGNITYSIITEQQW